MSNSAAFSITIQSSANALSTAAAAISPGNSATFPHNPNSTQYDIQWCINWDWDSARQTAHYSGKPASSQSHAWSHNRYQASANGGAGAWTRWNAFFTGTNPSGHVWGGHCIDPATGDYYLHLYDRSYVSRLTYATGLWDFQTADTGSGTDSIFGTSVTGPSNGMAWHPHLFGTNDPGFIIGTRYKIKAWRKSTNTWSNPTLTGSYAAGSAAGGSLYLPGAQVAVIGTGSTESTLWTVGAGSGGAMAAVVERGPTPIRVYGEGGGGTGSAKIIVDPRNDSRMLLLGSNNSSTAQVSADLGASWTSIGTHPFNSMSGAGTSNSWIAMGIPDYGVVWGLTDTASVLWRPPA